MNYRIEEKSAFTLTGFKKHFSGTPGDRQDQECNFFIETRLNQFVLKGMARDSDTQYGVMTNFGDDGYDFYIASKLPKSLSDNLHASIGEEAKRFGNIEIPAGLYLICETERSKYPTML